MAKKKLTRIAKLEFIATQARPGPALAGLGIDMGGFTKAFNGATKERAGDVVPVIIKCYSDRSFEFTLKTTPASQMILKALKLKKGSTNAATDRIATLTKIQATEIAQYKLEDLNAKNLEAAIKTIVGTCHNMGIDVEGYARKIKETNSKMIINENYEQQLADMEAGLKETDVATEEINENSKETEISDNKGVNK